VLPKPDPPVSRTAATSDSLATRLAGPFRVREALYPPGARMPPHSHDHPSVTMVLAGGLRESVGRDEDEATPLSVVVKPAMVRHADTFGPRGARTVQISWRSGTPLGEAEAALGLGWTWLHLREAVPEFLALASEIRAPGGTAAELESYVWDVLTAIAAGGRGHAKTRGSNPPRTAPRWIRRVKEELDDCIGEGLEVRELAITAGVHPGSLTRAFRRFYGETVTSYRTRERLRRAVAALAHREESLSRIAHESGFADHPHLCRCIKDATGLTPLRLRRALTGAT